jgi:hypothetical protein
MQNRSSQGQSEAYEACDAKNENYGCRPTPSPQPEREAPGDLKECRDREDGYVGAHISSKAATNSRVPGGPLRLKDNWAAVRLNGDPKEGSDTTCSGSGDRSTRGSPTSGSINEVGQRFRSCGINDLELVAQICPRWNRLQPWFELVGAFRSAAYQSAQ